MTHGARATHGPATTTHGPRATTSAASRAAGGRLAPRTRSAATVVVLAVLLLGSWLAPVAGIVPATAALAASTDLTLVTDASYTVQPEENRIRVVMAIVAKNNTRESRTRRFYFDHAFLAVQPGATDARITGAPGARVRVSRRSESSTLLRIDFGSRLYSGKSRTMKVSFNLVDKGTPAARQLRVGTALVTLPVWAYASTGARGSTVKVRIPAGYEVAVEAGSFDHRTTLADGATELRTDRLVSPLTFFAYVIGQKPAVFADTPLTVTTGDESVALIMRGWQDDPAWATRVGGLFERSLPVLRKDIGLAWPRAEAIVVQEAANRVSGAYEGLFDPAGNRIEVAYWADHLVVIHEAAHGWFNGSLLADRWANEGFATLYGLRAAAAIEEEATPPSLTEAIAAAAIPLNAWPAQAAGVESPDPAATPEDVAIARAIDDYGYAASYELAKAIAARAGDDVLREVWADAAAGTGAYQPAIDAGPGADVAGVDQAPEAGSGPPDWRGLLDLLEARTGEDFTDLWRTWVVRPDEAALLDARAAARLSYERTLALADGWALPRPIRDALRAWQFDQAEQLMADARTVLAQRGALESMAAGRGLALPDEMRPLFEAGQMVEASARAEAERNAMLAIGQADVQRSADKDLLTTIGMIGEDPEADLESAKASLAAGDLDGTLSSADDAYRAWNGAWQEGRRRALLALALLATIVVLASAVFGRVRKARGGLTATSPAAAAAVGGRGIEPQGGPAASLAAADADADREPTPEELLAAATPPARPID